MPLAALSVLIAEHPLQVTLLHPGHSGARAWVLPMCSMVLRQTRLSVKGASPCHAPLCHLCSHWCGNHLFILFRSEESVVTRTLISLHRHVSLSLVRNVAMLNTPLHTETGGSTCFQHKRSKRGGNDKQVMMPDHPSDHGTQPFVMLRSLLVGRLDPYHGQLQIALYNLKKSVIMSFNPPRSPQGKNEFLDTEEETELWRGMGISLIPCSDLYRLTYACGIYTYIYADKHTCT